MGKPSALPSRKCDGRSRIASACFGLLTFAFVAATQDLTGSHFTELPTTGMYSASAVRVFYSWEDRKKALLFGEKRSLVVCCSEQAEVPERKVSTKAAQLNRYPMASWTDVRCELTRQEISDLLEEPTRTWLIDAVALERVSNDIGVVINCTQENDIILFRVENQLRVPTRAIIPWNLTLSSYVENTVQEDGVFPEADRKVRFKCPRRRGIFRISAQRVMLANFLFEECVLDAGDESVIEVDECASNNLQGTVELHHVAFRRNSFSGTSGFSADSSSCSSVKMIDVVFSGNTCGDQCLARLTQENELRNLVLRRNVPSSEGSSGHSLLFAPNRSSSFIADLTASSNEVSVLRVEEGSLEMRDATIEMNSREPSLLLDRALAAIVANSTFRSNSAVFSGAGILANATKSLSISNCSFVSNIAENGSAIASIDGDLTVEGCSFRDNVAMADGGSLLVLNGSMELISSVFQNNSASGNGGALLLQESSASMLSEVQCRENAAGNGGCLWASASRRLVIRGSMFSNNSAESGGAVHCNGISDSNVTNTTVERNSARSSGGGISLFESPQMKFHDCALNNNSASTGGGLDSQASNDLVIRRCVFQGNRASLSGAGARLFESNASLEVVSWAANAAQQKGGGVFVERSVVESRECNYSGNSASDGAGLYLGGGTAKMKGDTFIGNAATVVGGGVATLNATIEFVDCLASQNVGGFGGGVSVASTGTVIRNVSFIQNRAATGRGGGFACFNSNISVSNSEFLSNAAVQSGGGIDVAACPVTAENLTIRENTGSHGGGVSVAAGSVFDLRDSVLENNSASDSGGLMIQDATAHLRGCTAESNSADAAGAIGVYRTGSIVIENSTVSSNRAKRSGGAFRCHEGEVALLSTQVVNNTSVEKGGCLHGVIFSAFNATNSSFLDNKGKIGGCVYIELQSRVSFHYSFVEKSSAEEDGGAAFVKDAAMVVNRSTFARNTASVGGSIILMNSSLGLIDSAFNDESATLSGGSVAANLDNLVTIINATFSNDTATSGGAIWLSSSNLTAVGLRVSGCMANDSGGGALANASSTVACSDCSFIGNRAHHYGGAIAFDSTEPQSLALQLNNSTFTDNGANLGGTLIRRTAVSNRHGLGAVHISTERESRRCPKSDASCTFAAVTGSVFSRNKASISGGAIFARDSNVLRYSCAPQGAEVPLALYVRDAFQTLDLLNSTEDVCPAWTDNEAGRYGPIVASYAKSIRAFEVNSDASGNKPVENNRLHFTDHRSGDPLPPLAVESLDGFGQGPALGHGDAYVQANLQSLEFFSGDVSIALDKKQKRLPAISDLQQPGAYEIYVNYSEDGIPSLLIEVEVRKCKIGESAQENGMLCVTCSGSQYNFDPDSPECGPCPGNGDCTTNVIHPNRHYWHRTPCSQHLQRCVSREACDFPGREEALSEVTSELKDCQLSETSDKDYLRAQCKKGYTGVLCGSCDVGYGRSRSFDCDECYEDSGTAMLFVLSLLILLFLSSFAIRGNLNIQSTEPGLTSRGSRRNRHRLGRPKRPSADVPVNFQMVEMLRSGEVPPEMVHPDLLARAANTKSSKSDPTTAKRTAVEIFKIIINFLQVIAAAAIINANWTAWMRSLLLAADFMSGAATASVVLSIDCLFAMGNDPPRSVIRSVVYLLVPLGLLLFYVALWIFLTRRYNENTWYFTKRALLSFLVVAYLTYVSITKTAVNSLHCIDVYDSAGVDDDHRDRYWALDTSLKCYEGSHVALATVVGWPVLIIFSFGLPVVLAYVLIRQRSMEPDQNPWLADATSFLYRAYKQRFIFWESIVMVRKAILTIVVAFSYPLGVNVQGILSVCVLALANHIHVSCQPFAEDFQFLNALEAASLVVSQLTFASGLLFNDDRPSDAVRMLVTVLLSIAICGLLIILIYSFLKSTEVYLKAVLEDEGIEEARDWGTSHVLRVFLLMRMTDFVRRLNPKRNRSRSYQQTDPGTSLSI